MHATGGNGLSRCAGQSVWQSHAGNVLKVIVTGCIVYKKDVLFCAISGENFCKPEIFLLLLLTSQA